MCDSDWGGKLPLFFVKNLFCRDNFLGALSDIELI